MVVVVMVVGVMVVMVIEGSGDEQYSTVSYNNYSTVEMTRVEMTI